MQDRLEKLRRANAAIRAEDSELAEESADLAGARASGALESLELADAGREDPIALESIIMRRTRPVLAIREDEAQLVFFDPEDSEIWKARLEKAAPFLRSAARAVGRIDLDGADFAWVGTGWLVARDIIVTNRHVANAFAARGGSGFSFSMGHSGPIGASVDFLQEIDNERTLIFRLVRPLHIEPEPGPDVAFFEIEMMAGDHALAEPIALADRIAPTPNVATIGYPAYDSRIPEPDLMEEIYGRIYNKKRLAPGGVTTVEGGRLLHSCTTLGGNSGSVVLDLDKGAALGLHFSGRFLATNYAVCADVVKQLLDRVKAGTATVREVPPPKPAPAVPQPSVRIVAPAAGTTAQITIPLTITISVGGGASPTPIAPTPVAGDGGGDIDGNEAVAADYADREGYRADFLGPEVPLPRVVRDKADVLEFDQAGRAETELRYLHYSVVMSRSRRMCFFSAVNIDGALSKKSKRVGWKWDPRIPRRQQIMNECYGNPPRFSRGHMTRREDPGWGVDPATAQRGNEDSMHVTNVTPQMQAFNSPIWLALEDYALDHARQDDMKICVHTGAYFAPDDPVMYGVRIPRAFWKIIAFIHDETGALTATGYEMNQDSTLQPEQEFVFGPFTSPQLGIATQVPIRTIEAKSGISFGGLAGFDPLDAASESVAEGPVPALASFDQIRFLG